MYSLYLEDQVYFIDRCAAGRSFGPVEQEREILRIRTPKKRGEVTKCLNIPLSWCNAGCGGYRFQQFNYGSCRGKQTCCYKSSFTREELAQLASRYVRCCPICRCLYVGGGGSANLKLVNAACSDEKCRIAWAQEAPCVGNICAVCGKPCLSKFTVTNAILPHLYPDRLFVGAEICLCPGNCFSLFSSEAEESLKAQAREMIEGGLPSGIKRELMDRFGESIASMREGAGSPP